MRPDFTFRKEGLFPELLGMLPADSPQPTTLFPDYLITSPKVTSLSQGSLPPITNLVYRPGSLASTQDGSERPSSFELPIRMGWKVHCYYISLLLLPNRLLSLAFQHSFQPYLPLNSQHANLHLRGHTLRNPTCNTMLFKNRQTIKVCGPLRKNSITI